MYNIFQNLYTIFDEELLFSMKGVFLVLFRGLRGCGVLGEGCGGLCSQVNRLPTA